MRFILSLSAALLAYAASLSDFAAVRTLNLQAETHHVQGIDLDGRRLWVTSVDAAARRGYLQELSLSNGELIRQVELTRGERFHPGGIAADRESLWTPVAEYRRESTSLIQRIGKRSLKVEFEFDVADHIGCIAVTGEHLIGGNWDSRQFYVWDRSGRLLRKVPSFTGNAYQDMKFVAGHVIASGLLPDRTGAIDWLDYPSFRLARRIPAGKTDRGVTYTHEGMAIRGGRLYLLPEDSPSRLFEFRMAR
jgi:uncharacterized protein DUF6454